MYLFCQLQTTNCKLLNQLDNQIVRSVYSFETKRTSIRFAATLLALSILILIGTISWMAAYEILAERHTLDLLELFREDWEIIREYFREVFFTFYADLPKDKTAFGIIAAIGVLIIIFSLIFHLKKILHRFFSLFKYWRHLA